MILSVQTGSILDPFGIDEGFRMIAEAGFGGVDINIDHCLPGSKIRAFDNSGFFDQTDEEILEACRPYKEAADKYGVKFCQAHAPFPNYVKDDATNAYVLHAVKKCIMMCGYFGCPNLVIHPGYLPYAEKLTKQQEWDYNIAMYTALIPELKQYGVTACLENTFSSHRGKVVEAICSDPREANRYIDALNEIAGEEVFGFCLDVGHANLLGRDLCEFICAMGDRIKVLHVHDNNGVSDEHLFPYMGVIDWDRFCKGLKEIGYKYDLSFETFNAMNVFDRALSKELLSLLHATGELFKQRILG